LAAAVDVAGRSLDGMLESADKLLLRYDATGASPSARPARAFDVREYTAGVKELAAAFREPVSRGLQTCFPDQAAPESGSSG
jgi:hypothetical protein